MTPTRRTLLIIALVLLSLFSIVFGFLGAWQIASTGHVPAALSTAPQTDPTPPIQVTINALILNGTPDVDTGTETAQATAGLVHAFLMRDAAPGVERLRTSAAPAASASAPGQALAERAVAVFQPEADAKGWTIAVALVDAQGRPVALARSPNRGM